MVANLGRITEVLKEMYKEPQNFKLVRAVLSSKTVGDKAVYLRDLLIENSSLKENKVLIQNLTEQNLSLENFSKTLSSKIEGTKDVQLVSFINAIKGNNSIKTVVRSVVKDVVATDAPYNPNDIPHEVTIYEPYPLEEDVYGNLCPTLVVATADADEGIGSRPVYNLNNEIIRYDEVLVNDEFAALNPTQIIGVNGIEPEVVDDNGTPISYSPEPPTIVPNLQRRILKVDIGDVTCTHNYDSFISFTGNGGGSEIRFTRSDGYLKLSDFQVLADNLLTPVPYNISRPDIRNARTISFNSEWDGDWETDNLQQFIAIYEEDNRNTNETFGQISSTLKLGSEGNNSVTIGPIGYKINFKSDDAIIFQGKLNRDVFEAMNVIDQGCGIRGGWAIRNCSSPVQFTMWHKVFIGN